MTVSGQNCSSLGAPVSCPQENHNWTLHPLVAPTVPKYVVRDDVHQLQLGPNEEDDVLDVSLGQAAWFEREHLFHLMLLCTGKSISKL